MQADEKLGPLGRHRQLGDGERRGVAGDQRAGLEHGVERGEGFLLELDVFDDRFDHQVAVGELGQLGDPVQAAAGGLALGRGEALLDRLVERLLDPPEAFCKQVRIHFPHQGRMSSGGDHLGDARAHEAAAQYADCLDLHVLGCS